MDWLGTDDWRSSLLEDWKQLIDSFLVPNAKTGGFVC